MTQTDRTFIIIKLGGVDILLNYFKCNNNEYSIINKRVFWPLGIQRGLVIILCCLISFWLSIPTQNMHISSSTL